MLQPFNILNHNGENLILIPQILDTLYLDQILTLQDEVIDGLPNPEWFASTSKEEFVAILEQGGTILGYLTPEGELAALGIYCSYGKNEHNYGYDLNIDEDKLAYVGQIECTIVKNTYRGNKLQQRLCQDLETFAYQEHMSVLSATVFPENIYSLNTFLNCGYSIHSEKLKYGGLRRYILIKSL